MTNGDVDPEDPGLILEININPRRKVSGQGLCSQAHLGHCDTLPRGKWGRLCVWPGRGWWGESETK